MAHTPGPRPERQHRRARRPAPIRRLLVVAAFTAAGRPAPNPRDNTSSNCVDVKCSELITTDAISVYVFDSEPPAVSFAAAYGAEARTATARWS